MRKGDVAAALEPVDTPTEPKEDSGEEDEGGGTFDDEGKSSDKAGEDVEENEANPGGMGEEEDDEEADDDDVSTDEEDGNRTFLAAGARGAGSAVSGGAAAASGAAFQAFRSTLGERLGGGVAFAAQKAGIAAPFTLDLAALGVRAVRARARAVTRAKANTFCCSLGPPFTWCSDA
jgi:hypothetical protein